MTALHLRGARAALCLLVSIAPAAAQDLVLASASNQLLQIDTGTPGTPISTVTVTGLGASETLVGIDFRPSNGQLYGLGSASQIYQIDLATGVATPVGGPLVPALNGTKFGIDFNPTVDRIRIVSNADQNLRVHPDTGVVAFNDSTLAYAMTDPNAGINPNIVAAAYTNNVAAATSTTLYDIDSNLDALVTQSPPNSGTLNTVGYLGINTDEIAAFDIAGTTKTAYAVLTSPGGGVNASSLFVLDLTTGAARFVSTVGAGEVITGMAVLPTPGAVQYGTATPGCFGNPAIGALGSPQIGNAAFVVKCVNAHPNTTGRLILGTSDLQTPFQVLGALVWVNATDPNTFWLSMTTDAMGSNTLPIAIPNDPTLNGFKLYLQYAWFDRCARGGLAASNALGLKLFL